MTAATEICTGALWYLEGYDDNGNRLPDVNIASSPFVVGRDKFVDLQIPLPSVSKLHAEITIAPDGLIVRDMGSKNGTFVNGESIQELSVRLRDRDLLQFANIAFRVRSQHVSTDFRGNGNTTGTVAGVHLGWAKQLVEFDRLLDGHGLNPHFQPIVRLSDESTIGYEALARSTGEGLETAQKMFEVASKVQAEVQLSRLLRRRSAELAQRLLGTPNLFLNTHPAELQTVEVLLTLDEIRELLPMQTLTLEIHEAAVTEGKTMRMIAAGLKELDIRLAFDDFGAGQARLHDLAAVSPDYVKFDMNMIRNIDKGDARRQQVLSALVVMVRDLGVAALAEGIETKSEAECCRQIGFEFAQGYYFGRPEPIDIVIDKY